MHTTAILYLLQGVVGQMCSTATTLNESLAYCASAQVVWMGTEKSEVMSSEVTFKEVTSKIIKLQLKAVTKVKN